MADGDYSLSITAVDDIGNSSTLNGHLVIDTTAPVVTFDSGELPASVRANTTFTGTVSDANISGVTVTLDDGNGHSASFDAVLGSGTWSVPVAITGLPNAAYTVSVAATDVAGNSSAISDAGTLTIDTVAPTATIPTIATADSTPALSGTVDDPTATVTVTIGGTTYNAINNGDGTWSLADNTVAHLGDGVYRLAVTATDPAGNQSVFTSALLTVHATVPKVTVNTLLATSTSPALSGTIDDSWRCPSS